MTTRISQIRERAEKASPGPWRGSYKGYSVRSDAGDETVTIAASPNAHDTKKDTWERWLNNEAFIAHARADIPWLLERLGDAEGLLHQAKSVWDGKRKVWRCPFCDIANSTGHHKDCRLAAFLAALAEGEEKDG